MATQGLVTVRSGGKVIMKVVTGSDGNLAEDVAKMLVAQWPVTAQEAFTLALEVGFGKEASLVVITVDGHHNEGSDELPELYRKTFADPEFNPRWARGTTDHLVIIDV